MLHPAVTHLSELRKKFEKLSIYIFLWFSENRIQSIEALIAEFQRVNLQKFEPQNRELTILKAPFGLSLYHHSNESNTA